MSLALNDRLRPTDLNLTRISWLVPVTAIGIALRKPTQDNSYLWHIEAGVQQLESGSVLTTDPFTFTSAGEPWRTQSWLVDLLYGWFERLAPLASADVAVLLGAAVLLGSAALRLAPQRRILGPLGVIWLMWLTLGYFTARPVFLSLALFALLTLVVDRAHLRWAIPLVFWIWAASHGGFIVGIGYLVLQGLREKRVTRAVDVVAAVVASSLTAHGWAVWGILLSFAGSSGNLQLIREWLPPDFMSIALWPFLGGIVALIWLGAVRKLRPGDLWIVVPFLVFAFTANRAVPLAAIAIVPFIFRDTSSQIGMAPLARPAGWSVVALIMLLALLAPIDDQAFETTFPVEAAAHLEEVPTFHNDSIGGYLIYQRFPYVFVDDRAELFGPLYRDFIEAVAARPGWRTLFDQYGIEQVLLPAEDTLVAVLRSEGWVESHVSDGFVVLVPS